MKQEVQVGQTPETQVWKTSTPSCDPWKGKHLVVVKKSKEDVRERCLRKYQWEGLPREMDLKGRKIYKTLSTVKIKGFYT